MNKAFSQIFNLSFKNGIIRDILKKVQALAKTYVTMSMMIPILLV